MRYWNLLSRVWERGCNKVDRLPMRYWNRSPGTGRCALGDTLIDYLWGIETWSGAWSCRRTSWVDRLPMRYWNPVLEYSPQSSTALIDYLWGIETLHPDKAGDDPVPLIDYLWGIETQHNQDSRWKPGVLIDYLWGIETRQRHTQCGQGHLLIDYLWGIETQES